MTREELLVNAKPILFNTEMIRAILDGRKTVTRRVIKTELPEFLGFGYDWVSKDKAVFGFSKYGHLEAFKPRYQVGDILYVRETFFLKYDGEMYFYLADRFSNREEKRLLDYTDVRWKPSIHMPKEAARIFLKVTNVRVERLKDITSRGAIKEGFEGKYNYDEYDSSEAIRMFIDLWNSTIKKQDLYEYGWEANPYVWVIEFERGNNE